MNFYLFNIFYKAFSSVSSKTDRYSGNVTAKKIYLTAFIMLKRLLLKMVSSLQI